MPNLRTVIAKGYSRITTTDRGKKVAQILPDLEFRVSTCCGHWEFSGATLGCQCNSAECPCRVKPARS